MFSIRRKINSWYLQPKTKVTVLNAGQEIKRRILIVKNVFGH